jgi:hypothetical protein
MLRIDHVFFHTAAIAALILGCGSGIGWSREEIGRITSPDSVLDAVIVRANGGATTAFVYELYLVPVGEHHDDRDPVFNAEHVKDLTTRWREARLLEVGFKEATIFHFSNIWFSKDVNNYRYVTEILLRPQTTGRSLSVYNRSSEDKSDTMP